jgi:hypothetical protein
MGCDIHLHIEIKLNNKWEHYACPRIERWYQLFAKMAGVRNYVESGVIPISLPKGIPEDVTSITKYDYERWDTDGHSHSWLNLKEIAELEDWLNQMKEGNNPNNGDLEWDILHCYLFGNSFAALYKYPEETKKYNPEITDVRFVFWFDN